MTVEAYAKVNLTLEVLGRRSDGYHDLRSVVCPVTLSDTLSLVRANVPSSDTGYENDLCVRAAAALGVGAEMRVVKRIPAGGGLGGGSADAAAVLVALDGMYDLGLTVERLAEKGAEVGSDVPALVMANRLRVPVVMEGRGERVRPLVPVKLHFVLVNPAVHSSTAEIFSRWTPSAGSPRRFSPTDVAEKAVLSGDIAALGEVISNDLAAPAISIHPEIGAALSALREEGVLHSSMTGSGACVFGLVRSDEESRAVAARLRARGFSALAMASL